SGEHLSPARVDTSADQLRGEAGVERQQIQAGDPHDRKVERLRERLRGGDADAQAREQPGPEADRNAGKLIERYACQLGRLQHRRYQELDVTSLARNRGPADPSALRPERDGRCSRRGLDAEDQHQTGTAHCANGIDARRARSSSPVARIEIRRSSSDVARISTSARASGRTSPTASPHSMNVIVSGANNSSYPRSMTS